MPGTRVRQKCPALSGDAVAGGAVGGTFGALRGVLVSLPGLLMIGAPEAGTTALPASPRTGRITEVTVAPGDPGCVDVVLPSCRGRLGFAPGHPPYEELGQKLAARPAIAVPAVTAGGMADASFAAANQQPVQPPSDSRRSS